MGRVGDIAGAVFAGALASLLAGALPDPAAAQNARLSGGQSKSRDEGPGIGGSFTGRVNLIGPPAPTTSPPAPAIPPSASPNSVFTPERLDKMGAPLIEGLRITKQPAATGPASSAPPPVPGGAPGAMPPAAVALPKQALRLTASFDDGPTKIPSGVKWRVFTDQPDANGEHLLVAESNEAAPKFDLDPGNYIVHAVYGLVSAAKFVTVRNAPSQQNLVIKAGGVRLAALVGDSKAPDDDVTFKLTRDEAGAPRTVAERVHPGALLRLPAGPYHVISNYGDANATVEVDLQIGAGKLVEAQVHHRAAAVELTLVSSPDGRELTNTSWTILTPGGDVIRDSIGALPKIVLAEGDYVAIARHDGRMFQKSFNVRAGSDEKVIVSAAN